MTKHFPCISSVAFCVSQAPMANPDSMTLRRDACLQRREHDRDYCPPRARVPFNLELVIVNDDPRIARAKSSISWPQKTPGSAFVHQETAARPRHCGRASRSPPRCRHRADADLEYDPARNHHVVRPISAGKPTWRTDRVPGKSELRVLTSPTISPTDFLRCLKLAHEPQHAPTWKPATRHSAAEIIRS